MKNARRIPLFIGLLLAAGTGVLLLNYLASLRSSVAAPKTRRVYIATHDIPARSLLSDELVTQTSRPVSEVDSDALVDRRRLAGSYSLITIPAGSIITNSKIGSAAANALPARLPAGMRAVSISIDRVKGVAGLIQPGDRVDVIAVPPKVGSEVPKASAILRGVLVLAMGVTIETVSATPKPETENNLTTVTLALTAAQADLIATADLNTTLRLALRSPKEPIREFATEPIVLGTPDRDRGTSPATPAPQTATPAPAPMHVAASQPQVRATPRGIPVIELDRPIPNAQ